MHKNHLSLSNTPPDVAGHAVFYRPEMVADTASYSRSASKPRLFMETIGEVGVGFEPVSRDDLYRAHDRAHVDDILDLRKSNGFGNRDRAVADSLPYTSGSMLAAARHALTTGGRACSPTSGFHHAGHGYASGFCTFNGLMVTALKLHHEGLVNKVGILDCDFHYGDGTQDIIDRLDLGWVVHRTSGQHFHSPRDHDDFFVWLRRSAEEMNDCDLVLYQAGQDMHQDDPLGGVIDTEGLRERDRLVGAIVHKPLVWNLAGGYMKQYELTLQGHLNTFSVLPPNRMVMDVSNELH